MGSFSTEPDYEGGQWIDGEFYGKAKGGQGGRRTKAESMLGVFGDSDSSGDEGRRGRGHGGGRADSRPLAAKPVAFTQSSSQPTLPKVEDEAEREAPAPSRGGLGSSSSSSSSRRGNGASGGQRAGLGGGGLGLGASSSSNLPAEKVDKDFGSFEVHSTGFGSRMLEKMGWTKGGAIGKQGQGIVNPLEAQLRPSGAGLNYGGYNETTKKAKAQQKRILHNADDADA